jgi:2-phosphosulfolactate phosphatase
MLAERRIGDYRQALTGRYRWQETGENEDMEIDVALLPRAAQVAAGRVMVVIDQIRASTTITTALDLGCANLLIAGDVRTARRLGRLTGSLLAGERYARKPPGFDFDNSPSELSRAGIRGRNLVLCTTNGTAVLRRLWAADHVLVGCLRNARAVAAAAVGLARTAGLDGSVQVVCAGRLGRFVLEDAVAAGVIAGRIVEYLRDVDGEAELTDAAAAAVRLRASYPDLLTAMEESDGGATLRQIGRAEDIAFCAEEDASGTVPLLLAGDPMRIIGLTP